MAAVVVSKTRSNLMGCSLIKVGYHDVGAFLGQPGGTGPADTVRSTGDYHRSTDEASKLSLSHRWSLPLCSATRPSTMPPLQLADSCANQHRADDHEHDTHDRVVVLDQPAPGTTEWSNHSLSIHHERRYRHDHCETADHGVAHGKADSRRPRQPRSTNNESGSDCEGELLRVRDR